VPLKTYKITTRKLRTADKDVNPSWTVAGTGHCARKAFAVFQYYSSEKWTKHEASQNHLISTGYRTTPANSERRELRGSVRSTGFQRELRVILLWELSDTPERHIAR